jgi:hypothetical protein
MFVFTLLYVVTVKHILKIQNVKQRKDKHIIKYSFTNIHNVPKV